MKKYMEIVEYIPIEEIGTLEPTMVRIEVQNEQEARNIYPEYEGIFEGKQYFVQYHEHKHQEHKPCVLKVLKEVM